MFQNNVIEYNFKLRKNLDICKTIYLLDLSIWKQKKWIEVGIIFFISDAFVYEIDSNHITELLYSISFLFTILKVSFIVIGGFLEDLFYRVRNIIERIISIVKYVMSIFCYR